MLRSWLGGSSKGLVEGEDKISPIEKGMTKGVKIMINLDSIEKQILHFANKRSCSQNYGFSSSHVWM